MALLKAFFDETGTHGESGITAIGGFVGHAETWDAIEPQWWGVLEEFTHLGVRFFHMSELLAQRGQFERIDKPNMNYIITQLSKLLGRSQLTPFFSAIVNADWHDVVKDEDFLRRYPHPIDLCFDNLVEHLWKWGRTYAPNERIVPMFAYSSEFSPKLAEVGRVYGAMDWYKKVLGPLSFGHSDEYVGLQAADLLAHQMNRDTSKQLFDELTLSNMGQTNALHWATDGQFVRENVFERRGLEITLSRFRERSVG